MVRVLCVLGAVLFLSGCLGLDPARVTRLLDQAEELLDELQGAVATEDTVDDPDAPVHFGVQRRLDGSINAWHRSDAGLSDAPLSNTPFGTSLCADDDTACIYGPWLERWTELWEKWTFLSTAEFVCEEGSTFWACDPDVVRRIRSGLDFIEGEAWRRQEEHRIRPIWSGSLIGFAPSGSTVTGDARLEVDIDNLTGTLDFESLQIDASGTWGDGDLSYGVQVAHDAFEAVSGDDGTVTGRFYGPQHQAMGGTLERTDLTAAFGGRR